MSHAAIAIILFVVTASASAFAVWRSIPLAHKIGMVDQPGPRRVHQFPIPRLGGPGIFIAFVIGVTLSFSFDVLRFTSEIERVALLVAGSAIIALVMLYDDAIGIAPLPKLLLQFGAAFLVVLPRLRGTGHGIIIDQFNNPFGGEITLPIVVAIGFTVFWIVGMMNTMNWIDGLDGLAATVTIVACIILFVHTYFWPQRRSTIHDLAAAAGVGRGGDRLFAVQLASREDHHGRLRGDVHRLRVGDHQHYRRRENRDRAAGAWDCQFSMSPG